MISSRNRSVNSWERNGRKNGYDMSDITNSFLDEAEIEIRAPGIFTLPVCTLSQARDHWEYVASGGRERGPHFPCPP